MNNKDYWAKRTLLAEKKAAALGEQLVKEQGKMYAKTYNKLMREIEHLATKAGISFDNISRTELYDYGRMLNLKEIIETEFTELTVAMNKGTESMLSKVYTDTLGRAAKDFGKEFIMPNEFQIKAVVEEVFHGSNYSKRIWSNNTALGGRVQQDMERLVMKGTSPQRIAKELQRDFNVGYSNAERLVRTEASRVYNSARETSYKEFGIEQVEFLAEASACGVCNGYDGKVYETGQGPKIPVHPRCRCAYAPVID